MLHNAMRGGGVNEGLFKCYITQWEVGGIWINADQHHGGACSSVITITRGWGCPISG